MLHKAFTMETTSLREQLITMLISIIVGSQDFFICPEKYNLWVKKKF